jgi:ABC-type lipoprotein export system ATPase subunit
MTWEQGRQLIRQSKEIVMETKPFVLCDNLVKIYNIAELKVVALQGLNLEIEQGEMMALIGPSGAGKSTLLNVIGGLDAPSAGSMWVAGWDLLRLSGQARVKYSAKLWALAGNSQPAIC